MRPKFQRYSDFKAFCFFFSFCLIPFSAPYGDLILHFRLTDSFAFVVAFSITIINWLIIKAIILSKSSKQVLSVFFLLKLLEGITLIRDLSKQPKAENFLDLFTALIPKDSVMCANFEKFSTLFA